MRLRRQRIAALLAGLLVLAGCGNDPDRIDHVQLGKEVLGQISGTAPTGPALADPASVLAQIDAPLILAQPQGGLSPFYLVGIRDNGAYRSYVTGTRQSFTLNRGIVTATRGLGDDLMSADISQTLTAIRTRKGGQIRRVMQYLDAGDVTRDLVLDCMITAGAGNTMTEDCRSDDVQFRNSYALDGSGAIISSTQWISARTGSVSFQVLRP